MGVGVEQARGLVSHHLLEDRCNRFALGEPMAPDFRQQPCGIGPVEHDRAGRPAIGKGKPVQFVQNSGRRDGREADHGQHPQMGLSKHRLETPDQGLVGQYRVQIHRYLWHADALAFGRHSRMQVS